MTDRLRELIEAEKAAVVPPPGAKEATWTALSASIAAGAAAPIGGTIGWILGILGAGGAALVGYMALRPAEITTEPISPPPPPPLIVIEEAPPPPPLPLIKKARSKPSLALQIAELRKAQLVFSRGNAEQALQLIAEHRRKFPSTPLEQERSALEALAACRLGRTDSAALSASFLDRWPDSPQADRVRRACRL
jgi:hypothetical protein